MRKWNLVSIFAGLLLLTLPACAPVEQTPTPRIISLEEEVAEEERAYEAIATAKAEKTQVASRVSPYVEISNDEQRYLAFWFMWNDETVFLPLNEVKSAELGLIFCQLDSEDEIVAGQVLSGPKLVNGKCLWDEKTPENAFPVIRIHRYFYDGIEIDYGNSPNDIIWNTINLKGEYAENFADVVTIIAENDLFGSGDLTLSLYKAEGPNGKQSGETHVVPSYLLPAEALQVTFKSDQLTNFEYVDDAVSALERAFTWKVPTGFDVLGLSPGDENWFVLKIRETNTGDRQVDEYLGSAYIQIIGVGTPSSP